MLKHFLEHPDTNGFKAQLVAVDCKAPEWSDVIIASAQNSGPEIERFEYEIKDTVENEFYQSNERRDCGTRSIWVANASSAESRELVAPSGSNRNRDATGDGFVQASATATARIPYGTAHQVGKLFRRKNSFV